MIGRLLRNSPTERDLAALADGSLAPERRARVERAVAASTALQAQLRDERYALDAVRAVESERAPAALRARVALARPVRRRPRRVGAFARPAASAIAAARVDVLGGGRAAAPSVPYSA